MDHEEKYTFQELVDIVDTLRGPQGCPWDREQTHESLITCLENETAEVVSAINNKDDENLCEELGDVLLQVLMHSCIAREEGRFTLEDVIDMLARKMVRRHPHVFGDRKELTTEEVLESWEEIKLREKKDKSLTNNGETGINNS